jgi:hypothetical protein
MDLAEKAIGQKIIARNQDFKIEREDTFGKRKL